MVIVTAGSCEEFLTPWRFTASVPVETIDLHVQTTELGIDVWAFRQWPNCFAPLRKNTIRPVSVAPDTQWSAKVIQNDCGIRKDTCQLGKFGNLGVVAPPFETQVARCQMGKSFLKHFVRVQALTRTGPVIRH